MHKKIKFYKYICQTTLCIFDNLTLCNYDSQLVKTCLPQPNHHPLV